MEKVKPALLKGFDQEFLPAEQLQFNALVDSIRRTFELFGYLPIETPSAERKEILTSKGGMEKEIYAITRLAGDPGDTEASRGALHFDLTVPLARYVAMREHQLAFPFRRYQIQRVWRGENPQANKGRFREFYQCDIDIIGKGDLGYLAEAEIPSVIHRVFSEMAIGPFRIRLNNRKLLKGLLQHFKVSDEAAPEVFRIMDKAEKEDAARTLDDLQRQGLAKEASAELLRLITHKHEDVFRSLSSYAGTNELCAKGVDELKAVVQAIRKFDVPEGAFGVDLGVVRGLDYYTGTIYETTLLDHPELGSICSGGRYDDLAGYFTNTKLPGVGISIGLSRLFSRLKDAQLLRPPARTPAEVLVTAMDAKYLDRYIDIANRLRRAGINTELYLESAKLGKQLEYASKKGFLLAIVAGENEFGRDAVQLKDLGAQKQIEVNLGGLVEAVLKAKTGTHGTGS
jgi:histidyl-tRNA synthetase